MAPIAAVMPSWSAHAPVRTSFGVGALDALGDRLGARRAWVLLYPEAVGGPLHARIAALLGERCAGVLPAPGANPDLDAVAALHDTLWSSGAQAEGIVAVGGGSTIDTAKALALGVPAGGFEALRAHLRDGAAFMPARRLALIAVPTTAGTGSEVTRWATLWDRSGGAACKRSLDREDGWPEAALVDPLLTLSCPAGVTLASGLDALSHALEAIWNKAATPYSDALAVQAARGVVDALPRVLDAPADVGARTDMACAALLAGLAFSQTRTAVAHALSYGVTLARGTPHGIACAFSLPEVWRRASGCPARDAVLSRVLPVGERDGPEWLGRWLSALGVSTRFADYGLADPDRAIAEVIGSPRGRNFIGAPA
jgi:phosphonate metabolism-associated iron-containing alcohol dehydrogenase